MQLDKALTNVSIIGSGGKMGRGIATLLLLEISKTEMTLTGELGSGSYCLNLIDENQKSLNNLKQYLKSQILKFAEKNINLLRDYYSNNSKLVTNREIIEAYVEGTFNIVNFTNSLEAASDSFLIFEAIVEDIPTKVDLFLKVKSNLNHEAYFFTNTSSIPIHVLDQKSHLDGCIIGFHFYNPPVVQKLVELIIPEHCNPELKSIAEELVKRLKKLAVYSQDVAGFIGNGHFMREIVFASENAENFEKVYLIDVVTRDYLLRPMGIFQLMDYVGLDVCQKVLKVMQEYLPESKLHSELIDLMIKEGKIGGQILEGHQRSGFFEYEGNTPKAVYSVVSHSYIPLSEIQNRIVEVLGNHPEPLMTWKNLQFDKNKQEKISSFLKKMQSENNLGSQLGTLYLNQSKLIGLDLVKSGVAKNIEDVNQVLENGFYHLYGVDPLKVIQNEKI